MTLADHASFRDKKGTWGQRELAARSGEGCLQIVLFVIAQLLHFDILAFDHGSHADTQIFDGPAAGLDPGA
jgi:hypothetical protein